MPEGDLHRHLVSALADLIRDRRSGTWFFFADANGRIDCEGVPPQLESVRPDIYAREPSTKHLLIGEAKTSWDIDNPHTERQLHAYFLHLAAQTSGELIIAVPLLHAGTAYSICNRVRVKAECPMIPFEICGWLFGRNRRHVEVWRG